MVRRSTKLETTVIRDSAGLAALRDDWRALLDSSDTAEIFQTHEWMSTWWEVFGRSGERELFIIAIRDGGHLIGLAPFLLRTIRQLGPTRVRRLEFIGTGEPEADEVCSDFLDILVAPEQAGAVVAAVWDALVAARADWDEAMFTNVLQRSLLATRLQPLAQDSARTTRTLRRSQRYFVDLSGGSFDDYLQGLSKKRRKRLAYCQRRLEKDGDFVQQRLTSAADFPAFLAELARLNLLRRTTQRKPSAFASVRFRRFHELVAPRLWAAGWLDLRLWWRNGVCVAALYNFVYRGTIYYYQSGFDTAAFGNLSPGLVTLLETIRWGIDHGLARFDFQIGARGSYKEDYGCHTEPTVGLMLYNDSAAATVMRSARDLRQVFRTLRARYAK